MFRTLSGGSGTPERMVHEEEASRTSMCVPKGKMIITFIIIIIIVIIIIIIVIIISIFFSAREHKACRLKIVIKFGH